jgi:ABC-type bacteriocin/lantibiotic exporter with double-glycine peptidase domain
MIATDQTERRPFARTRDEPGPAISCQGVYYRYSSATAWIINNFSHQFQAGITLIKGASGCGKSTLLRLLAGYLTPNQGAILNPLGKSANEEQFQRQQLGFVFQQL